MSQASGGARTLEAAQAFIKLVAIFEVLRQELQHEGQKAMIATKKSK